MYGVLFYGNYWSLIFSNNGKQYAIVLPDPVLSYPIISCPSYIGSKHCYYIGNRFYIPLAYGILLLYKIPSILI